MNLTKAEVKAALQAMLNSKYGTNKYTVGDGAEFICAAADLKYAALKAYHIANELSSQSMFYGILNLNNSHASQVGAGDFVATQKQGQYPAVTTITAERISIPVGKSTGGNEVIFSYLNGENIDGTFHGYKFEVTTVYQVQEDGTLALDEAQQPIVAP